MMISSTIDREKTPVALSRLWAGVLVAPAAWVVAELVGYFLAARACDRGSAGAMERVGITQDALAIGLAVIAVVGLVVAIGNWRSIHETSSAEEPAAVGRMHFMSLAGVIASGLFVLGIVLFAVPPLFVNACNHVR